MNKPLTYTDQRTDTTVVSYPATITQAMLPDLITFLNGKVACPGPKVILVTSMSPEGREPMPPDVFKIQLAGGNNGVSTTHPDCVRLVDGTFAPFLAFLNQA